MSEIDLVSETEARLVEENRAALAEARADGRLDRLIAAATKTVLASNFAPAPPVSSTWRKLGGAGLAGVIALAGAGYVATSESRPTMPVSAAPSARASESLAASAPADMTSETAVAPPPADESVVAVEALPAASSRLAVASTSAKIVVRERAAPSTSTAAPSLPVGETAASLFRRANTARHAGDDAVADELYRRLLDDHPETREAATARVIFGRMRLERGDASHALAQFDAYLAGRPGGTLTEQALVGRARCLRALGRRDDERAAWAALLRAFPESASKSEALDRGR